MNRRDLVIPSLKSLFIEARFGETVLGTGTAFLVANNQQSHCTLITNRHVVTGRDHNTGECLNKNAGVPDNMVIHFHANTGETGECEWREIQLPLFREDGSPYWIEHSVLADKADVVALNLRWGDDISRYPYYLETELDRLNIEIGPAENVSVIGFPFGRSVQRFPIWVTGFLSQDLSLVTPESPTFLIDCRTRQGQSGSPVLAFRAGNYRKRTGDKVSVTMSPTPVWELLGIYSGRINRESDLGVVWHVSVMEDILAGSAAEAERRFGLWKSKTEHREHDSADR